MSDQNDAKGSGVFVLFKTAKVLVSVLLFTLFALACQAEKIAGD